MSNAISWRVTFLLVGCWGVIILYYIWRWVPHVEGLKDTGFKGQFRFLKTPVPWLILGATALGNGGVFCWYSYINPLLTNVSGFSAESITGLMVLAGFGMVVGNLVSGRLSDQYTPGKVGTTVQAMICVVLLLIFFLSPYPWLSALLMCLCTAGLFAVSSPEQVLIIRVAKVERCWERLVCKWHLTWEMPSVRMLVGLLSVAVIVIRHWQEFLSPWSVLFCF